MQTNKFGSRVIFWAENVGLIIIAIATVIAVGIEVSSMISAKTVTLADLLLLFIYLEVLAMVAMYLDSDLILDMKSMDNWRMLGVSGAILLIAIAILLHRYGHTKFPYKEEDNS